MSISGRINYLQEVGAGKAKYWFMDMMMMTTMMTMMTMTMIMTGMRMSGMMTMTISAVSLDWAAPAFTLLPHEAAVKLPALTAAATMGNTDWCNGKYKLVQWEIQIEICTNTQKKYKHK